MKAFVFPGQGTQRPGMGSSFYRLSAAARDRFDEATEVLGYDLAEVCFRGAPEVLIDTRVTQPAVFVVNLAAQEMLLEWGLRPDLVAGHSVGEWSAVVAAGMLGFADGLRMVARRAELMATVRRRGAMTSILGLDHPVLQECCRAAGPTTVVAVDNGPGNFVIAGATEEVEAAAAMATRRGALRATPLRVGHGFHSPLLSEVRPAWDAEVAKVDLARPRCPVALNATGSLTTSTDEIRDALARQIDSPVRWHDCVRALGAAGCSLAIEVGDSRFLRRLGGAIDRSLRMVSLDDLAAARRRLAEVGAAGA